MRAALWQEGKYTAWCLWNAPSRLHEGVSVRTPPKKVHDPASKHCGLYTLRIYDILYRYTLICCTLSIKVSNEQGLGVEFL